MDIKAKTHKLMMEGDGQFGTRHVYECDLHPIEEATKQGFFSSCRNNLLPGDTIRVVEISKDQVTAQWEVIVIARLNNDVVVASTQGGVKRFEAIERKKLEPSDEPRVEFIKGSGSVKWNLGKKKFDVFVDGKVVAVVRDKEEAHSIARGDAPILQPAA